MHGQDQCMGESKARPVFMLTPGEHSSEYNQGKNNNTQHHSNYELRHHVGWRILRERGARVPLNTHQDKLLKLKKECKHSDIGE